MDTNRKTTLILILALLGVLTVFCAASGSTMGSQAGVVAQAQANKEMAEAVGTQARVNGWIIFFVVGGMVTMAGLIVVALGVGLKLGQRQAPVLPAQSLRQLPALPPYPTRLPEGELEHLAAVELYELLTAGEEWQ